jgi:toxin YoeB
VVSWRIVYTPQAAKDALKLAQAGLKDQTKQLLSIVGEDPFASRPRSEKLLGHLSGAYSRRINIKHRLVYQVLKEQRIVKVLRMWTCYE